MLFVISMINVFRKLHNSLYFLLNWLEVLGSNVDVIGSKTSDADIIRY
jgi:hypothetical protein